MQPLASLYRSSLALLTDLYQLTMAYGYWKSGLTDREAVFHLSFRHNLRAAAAGARKKKHCGHKKKKSAIFFFFTRKKKKNTLFFFFSRQRHSIIKGNIMVKKKI